MVDTTIKYMHFEVGGIRIFSYKNGFQGQHINKMFYKHPLNFTLFQSSFLTNHFLKLRRNLIKLIEISFVFEFLLQNIFVKQILTDYAQKSHDLSYKF